MADARRSVPDKVEKAITAIIDAADAGSFRGRINFNDPRRPVAVFSVDFEGARFDVSIAPAPPSFKKNTESAGLVAGRPQSDAPLQQVPDDPSTRPGRKGIRFGPPE